MSTSKIAKLVDCRLNALPTRLYDKSRPDPKGFVGIEIEIENVNTVRVPNWNTDGLWTVEDEGSLQGGVELVSVPLAGKRISQALEAAQLLLDGNDIYTSFRTSVHVHVNVLDLTCEELTRFINAYVYYEPAFFRLHAEWQRAENIFCIPTYKSFEIQEAYRRLLLDLKKGTVSSGYLPWKYSALNSNSISRFGTLEFRHMGGTTKTEDIDLWVNILLQLKESAKNKVDPEDAKEVFGEYYKHLRILKGDIDQGNELLTYIQ